jgi:DNA polymerase
VKRLWLDLETYSTVDLRKATPYAYAEDPEFKILMCAWSNDGKNVHVAFTEREIFDIPGLWDEDVIKVAHNAPFERICLSAFGGMGVGHYLPAEMFHDTQAIAAELGYPQGLDALGKALGGEQKDSAGTALINLFCKPNRKGVRNTERTHPDKWKAFVDYCRQDVVTLIDVDHRLGDWPTDRERRVYLADQVINDTGIRIDVDLARAAVEAAENNQMVHELEFSSLTGVVNPGSTVQVMDWADAIGLDIGNLQKETIEKALSDETLDQPVKRALELRQELALVASKKFGTALTSVSPDGRLRGSFRFFGAHTGRWAGRGTQVHNLPREAFDNEADTELAIAELKAGEGASALDLKRLVRPLFRIDGAVVDYSAIEARVIAWLAGEDWALKAFYDGRDIYVETAKRMGNLTRAQGKVAVLALGFAGGINSLRVMGAKGDDDELKALVYQWRNANPHVVRLWRAMENAVEYGGKVGPQLNITRHGEDMALHLPSGRAIWYHGVRWEKYTIQTDEGKVQKEGWRYDDPKPPHRRIGTYGGRLTENATQAVARDILAEALVRLVDRGYKPVGHVHDEILLEDTSDVDEVTKVMCEVPDWATGLPIDGEGFSCRRYRKG